MTRLKIAIFLSLSATTLVAQVDRVAPAYTYAAKFVCGQSPASPGPPQYRVPPAGMYFSSVNVHNPSRWESVTLRKKFAIALPGEESGRVSPYFDKTLRADDAMQSECADIYRHFGMAPGQFIEGYAVFESPRELDVVTVYAAGSGAGNQVTTLHTERVPVRAGPRCLDLDLSLRTGTAPWTLTVDPSGGSVPRAASVIAPPHPWETGGVPLISFSSTGSSSLASTWEYQTTFCLCTGAAKLNITKLQADNVADVFLNGPPSLGTVTGNATTIQLNAINAAAAARLVTGQNVLTVRVRNDGATYTGFSLDGSISGANVGCPR